MLYQFHEMGRALFDPIAHLAHAYSTLLAPAHCPAPLLPFARTVSAGWELLHRLGKRYDGQGFNVASTSVAGRRVDVTEEIVDERPFCKLLHFRRTSRQAMPRQPKVLLVAPLAGHYATLLRDTVRELIRDHDVYVTSWTNARMVPVEAGPFGLADYVDYVRDFMHMLGPDLHVVAVCQATVPVLGAVALDASARNTLPRSMTLIAGPVDTRRSPTEVNRLATGRPLSWFQHMMIHAVPYGNPGAGRQVYPGFIQHACFVSMGLQRHADSHRDFYERRCRGEAADKHCAFYDEYNATLDMPAEFYIDTIETVFQESRLARGTWQLGGRAVRPQDIETVALFTVEGERDDITGLGQTAAAHELCSGIPERKRKRLVVPDGGHYCVFSGRRWRQVVYPQLRGFIQAHEQRQACPPPSPANADERAMCA